MRSRSLIGADCSLTLHCCHRAGSRARVNHCHNMIGPETRGETLCRSGHFVLPVNGDSASSVRAALLCGPLSAPLQPCCLEGENSQLDSHVYVCVFHALTLPSTSAVVLITLLLTAVWIGGVSVCGDRSVFAATDCCRGLCIYKQTVSS